ncbi:MinD/ParA family protein [Blastopirellula sp. JC732]|uniref:MinD/ParA family protein n=1 Tax=Blastopirellula sediminis TaxID=2894196 RepID=A0A9X1MJL4_9BACT|nr:MinD/ParA family protein [Blastopirellula sediminis]MCC9609503.1 MinD/ParA family protein [Blastopirellula sediminis]MCC9627721.1 MinD/ParA family protein [Blastopirellula sediminis]
MAQIVSIHSFRGGTGKSNTTANLAVTIARRGYRVAVVDTDIQSPGVHVLFRLDEKQITHSINDYLWGKCEIEKAAYDMTTSVIGSVGEKDERPRLFLVPASIDSGEIGRILKEGYDVGMLNDGFKRLIRELNLDFLLIDTHPGVNEETLLSIVVSNKLVLVMRPDSQDFQGTAVTLELARRLDVAEILLVINKIPPGMDRELLRQKVEQAYDADVAAMLPMNYEIVHLASSGIFSNRYPDHPFTIELQNVANALIQ